jgi:hypothetical protein
MNNLQSMGTATAGRAQGDTGEKDKRLALERFSTSSVSAPMRRPGWTCSYGKYLRPRYVIGLQAGEALKEESTLL